MPAVANAVYDAVGVRIDEVPITPEKILKALQQKAAGKPRARRAGNVPGQRALARDAEGDAALGRRRRARVERAGEEVEAQGRRRRRGDGGGAAMMRLPRVPLSRAAHASAEAAAWLADARQADTMLVAGGTDLLPNMKRRQQTPST